MWFSLQEYLIFSPEKLPLGFDYDLMPDEEEFFLQTPDMQSINSILCKVENSKGIILYFHGNKGSLRTWKTENVYLKKFGYDILMIDFRGYGKSTGSFSEKGIYLDAETAYAFAIKRGYAPEQILIYGRSLGTGIASLLALRHPAKALILEAPYTSMLQMAKLKYPLLFPYIFLSYKFDTIGRAASLKLPVLLIHGKMDKTIPYVHSEKIYKALKTDKKLLLLPEADHNGSSLFPEYFDTITSFIS
jgi:fermentation-respiration switch protein FrsA (DUF1100 family)